MERAALGSTLFLHNPVSIHKNVAILSDFIFMHDCALAKIFFAWREKLVVQVSVNRLLAVLCGRTGGSRWTQKECWAKLNVLPVHLNHIKPIIFGHPLSLYLFFIAVTWGERLEMDLPFIVKYWESLSSMLGLCKVDDYGNLLDNIWRIIHWYFRVAELYWLLNVFFCAQWKFVKSSNGTTNPIWPGSLQL